MIRFIGWGFATLVASWGLLEFFGAVEARVLHEREVAEYAQLAQTEIILKNPVVAGKITVPRSIIGPSFLELAKQAKEGRALKSIPLLVDYTALVDGGKLVPAADANDLQSSIFMQVAISKTGSVASYISSVLKRGTLQNSSNNDFHEYELQKYVYKLHQLKYEYFTPQNKEEIFFANCNNDICQYHFLVGNNYAVTVRGMLISRLHDWRKFKHSLTQALLPLIDTNVVEVRHGR